ncbi:MAG: 50S ribosomal protein L10 [Bacteroidia bacterium]
MTRDEKNKIIDQLVETLSAYNGFYVTDISTLTVEKINQLRRLCFNKGVKLSVAKNTLIQKALERMNAVEYEPVFGSLKGSSALMLSEGSSIPAKLIKEFRKKGDRPLLKCAYVESSVFIGDNQLDILASLKTKNELIGEIIGLLQSPMQRVLGGLQSGGHTIAGIIKTLESR